MLTGCCLLNLTHIKVSILQINPSQTLFDLHLNSTILDFLQITIFLSVFLYCFSTVRNLLLELLNLKSRVVEIPIKLLELSCYFIEFFF